MSGATAIVIGAGADALTCAHYLARSGARVVALEQHPGTDEMAEGWTPPRILRDLGLDRGGPGAAEARDPWISVPLPAGGRLQLWRDLDRSVASIRKVSPRDAASWPRFCARMANAARLLEALYEGPPPDPMTKEWAGFARLAAHAMRGRRLGRQAVEDFLRLLPMSVADLLDDWFETDALKAAVAAAGVKNLLQGPRSGGTAFVLLHHHAGSPVGVFRPPRSRLASALADRPGVEIRRGARVARILVAGGRATGVALENGEELRGDLVVSAAGARETFTRLLDPAWLDPELVQAAMNIRSRGAAARVVLTLEGSADGAALLVAPSLDYMERAYDDAKYRRPSRDPWLESIELAPGVDARPRIGVHVQYAPYACEDGDWNEERCEIFGARAESLLTERVPGLAGRIAERVVWSPRRLENELGWPEGQPNQAEIALDQALWMRPLPALAQYDSPVGRLYLCGPGTHPGGGIPGASGAHAARKALRDLRR